MASKVPDELQELMKRSEKFASKGNKFPVTTTLTKTLLRNGRNPEMLLKNVNEAYPLIHEDVVGLIKDFIALKKKIGSKIEKSLYAKMDVAKFVDRLLEKRPLTFVGAKDKFLQRNPKSVDDVKFGDFEAIGTKRERKPLIMKVSTGHWTDIRTSFTSSFI